MYPEHLLFSTVADALSHPFLVPFVVAFAGMFFEDAATIFVAILSADGYMPPWFALGALYTGIILGDLGYFGLGRLAVRHRWARWFVNHEHVQNLKPWLEKRFVAVVWTARFVPGLRFPTYLAAGFFGMPFGTFFFSVVPAVLVWTTCLFTLAYQYGALTEAFLGHYRWIIALIPLALLLLVSRIWKRQLTSEPKP
ncbi:MAG: VTT domain-containing protein [Minisyncoccia bacterium]